MTIEQRSIMNKSNKVHTVGTHNAYVNGEVNATLLQYKFLFRATSMILDGGG